MNGTAPQQLSPADFERRVLARQLELLSAPARSSVVATPVWAVVVCSLTSGVYPVLGAAPLSASLLWLAAVACACGIVLAADTSYRRAARDSQTLDPIAWWWVHTAAYSCLSVSWAALIWVFWIDGNIANQLMLAIFALCGVTNGVISRLHKFESFLIGSGVSVLVLWLKFVTDPSDIPRIFGLLVPLWFCAMAAHVRLASAQVRRNIEIQVENEVLHVALVKARDDAEAARLAAVQANQTKNSFLANMSHELRTPLNAILGFSEVIACNALGDAPERYRGYASDINGSGQHLLSLINDILDVAKIEAGKMEIAAEWLDGGQALGETLKLVRDRAAAKNVALHGRCDADARVFADARAFKQILLNLLSNAIKFTSAGHVSVALSGDGAATLLVVEDTGCGISRGEIGRVFNAFEQADNRYAHAHGGTGLGLTLVRALSELHGGTCAIESEPGKGTRVVVRLPLPEDALRSPQGSYSHAA
jgi:two-component system cell cycle sensor histidine kinase PleC